MTKIYDSRVKKYVDEPQFGGSFLHVLYNTIIGRLLLKILFARPWFWRIVTPLGKKFLTTKKVQQYMETYHIDPAEYEDTPWRTFDEFFGRRYKQDSLNVAREPDDVIAVAEGKLLSIPITSGATIRVKWREYDIASIVGSSELAKEFEGGLALVYRLSMHNYHRYVFPAEGMYKARNAFAGMLHTVSSLSREFPVYSINQRNVSVLATKQFGDVAMVEVGAMLVGKIVNHDKTQFTRGEEKGLFTLGGSTVIILYKKNTVELTDIIKKNNEQGIEVTVMIGERIGRHV